MYLVAFHMIKHHTFFSIIIIIIIIIKVMYNRFGFGACITIIHTHPKSAAGFRNEDPFQLSTLNGSCKTRSLTSRSSQVVDGAENIATSTPF